jgi:hypothetical protein
MKFTVLLVAIFISSNCFSQDGFKLIRKAEKKIEQGKLSKASHLLNQADGANYGFCGNAWLEARDAVAGNRAQIFELQGKSEDAAMAIWDLGGPFSGHNDSLKMTYLIKAYGIDSIKSAIDESLDSLILSFDHSEFTFMEVQFSFADKPYIIHIYTLIRDYQKAIIRQGRDPYNTKDMEVFRTVFREQSFYRLLLEEE